MRELADVLRVDLEDAVQKKLAANECGYPPCEGENYAPFKGAPKK